MCTINALTVFFMFCQQPFQKHTLSSFFVFLKHKSVKIFDIHIMWLVFISYKQQLHWIFKFLIWNVNWKSQFVFITIQINANVVFRFNIAKIFFSNRKPNPIIIKIISKLLLIFCNSFWMYFYRKTSLIVIFHVD